MPRTTNLQGLRALILHNVFKQLKRITKDNKNAIVKFVHSLPLEELKQKGIVKQIVSQFKDGKPRKNLIIGGMKRPNDDDEDNGLPRKRNIISKAVGWFTGRSTDDEKYNLEEEQNDFRKIFEEERKAVRRLEKAKERVQQAKLEQENAQRHLENIKYEKSAKQRNVYMNYRNNRYLENIRAEYMDELDSLEISERGIATGSPLETVRDRNIDNLRTNYDIYFHATGEQLPRFQEIINRYNLHSLYENQQRNVGSSEVSSSSNQPQPQPLPLPQPQPQLLPLPQPQPQPQPQPALPTDQQALLQGLLQVPVNEQDIREQRRRRLQENLTRYRQQHPQQPPQ